jgi:serine/threonine protein kinase/Tol biopolymer transport system component
MDLPPGSRLGPYQIVAPLGAGGMGEVYKARDTRLERTVAIKILPEALAADPQFRDRFDREARAVSKLEHPHICALYDVGRQDDTAYLVMQYLEGETLAERLQKGPLPVEQALQCGFQIAEALARAHRAGIIHRDLKPGNIMLTKSGAKLLDFGLAKAIPSGPTPVAVSSLPTTPAGLTVQGTILGTFQYMAPEQIEGAEADARSDIWAFGCVLYEMVTGGQPFGGKSPASLRANILHAEPPPLRERQPLVPGAVDHAVRRCLEKDPDARWQAIADVGHELRWALTAVDAAGRDAPRPLWRQPLVYAAAACLIAAGAAVAYLAFSPVAETTPSLPSAKLTLVSPSGLTFTPFGSAGTPHFALSPDGRQIAFVATAAGRPPTLWLRRLDSRVPREIAGSADASSPFWSPDGRSLGFFAEGRLKTIAADGERPSILATIIDAAGATSNGEVILVGRATGPVVRIAVSGGPMSDATVVRPDSGGHRSPQFLPDGRQFIYAESRGSLMLSTLDSAEATPFPDIRSTAVYAPPGFLLFVRASKLMAQRVDASSMAPVGASRELLDQASYASGGGYPPVSVSTGGLLAYWDGTTVSTELAWFDRQGNRLATLPVPERAGAFAISPDGRRLAFTRPLSEGSAPTVWLMEASGATSRFSFASGGATRPIWSADGEHIFFTSFDGERPILLRRAASAAEKEQSVGTVPSTADFAAIGNYYATDWTRDGRTALISITAPATARDISAFAVETGRLTPLFHGAAYEIQARFSPDNRWIAYASNETGRWEVFVEPVPPSGPRWQVSADGGSQPVWRRDGKELFFLAPDAKLMVASVSPGATFVHGRPQALFETVMRPTYAPYPANYDATPDGQRFLIAGVRPGTGPTISIVLNWQEELKSRVPPGR